MKTYYSYKTVDDLVRRLQDEYDYECCQIFEGTLGSGDWICVPPDDNYYYYIIKEVPLNSQSSGHTIRKCSKLSKVNEQLLIEYYAYGTR